MLELPDYTVVEKTVETNSQGANTGMSNDEMAELQRLRSEIVLYRDALLIIALIKKTDNHGRPYASHVADTQSIRLFAYRTVKGEVAT